MAFIVVPDHDPAGLREVPSLATVLEINNRSNILPPNFKRRARHHENNDQHSSNPHNSPPSTSIIRLLPLHRIPFIVNNPIQKEQWPEERESLAESRLAERLAPMDPRSSSLTLARLVSRLVESMRLFARCPTLNGELWTSYRA